MVIYFGLKRFVWPITAVNSQMFVLCVCIVIIITAHVAQMPEQAKNVGLIRTKGQLGSPVLSIFRHVFSLLFWDCFLFLFFFYGFGVFGFLPGCIIVKWNLEFS